MSPHYQSRLKNYGQPECIAGGVAILTEKVGNKHGIAIDRKCV